MDLLSMYELYPVYELADYVLHTPKTYNIQFEGYFCPFSCEDVSIWSDLSR